MNTVVQAWDGTTGSYEFDFGNADRVTVQVCTRYHDLPRHAWCGRPPLTLTRH